MSTVAAPAVPFLDQPSPVGPAYPLVGVVGGMGPLASAQLLSTVYQLGASGPEQHTPRVLLWSDPDVVDRTEAIESGRLDALRAALEHSIGRLLDAGASRVVIACMTAHSVLAALPMELSSRCVSLVDVVFDELAVRPEPHLLLCTRGSVLSGLFTGHPRWASLGHRLVELAPADQAVLHDHIYRLKRGADCAATIGLLRDELLPRYRVPAFVAACTELHLVTRAIEAAGLTPSLPGIDPLSVVARRIVEGTL